jgi:glyoxylase-like metal-dependent hydrolase (beta-lactamase superfamily II)
VLVAGFPAGVFATNCYIVAPSPGAECVIIDPGQQAERGIDEVLREHRLKPVAVLLTHGHIDHIWSVVPVCGANDVPAYIHPGDREMLSDPTRGFPDTGWRKLLGRLEFSEPDEVRELADGATLRLAGVDLVVRHAPGHTRGSVAFWQSDGDDGDDSAEAGRLFSGDLLFAGSIGRTDLPGGDYETILDSLARVCLPLPDETVVLCGHGPETTIGRERTTNPYLSRLVAPSDASRPGHAAGPVHGDAPAGGPTRGL